MSASNYLEEAILRLLFRAEAISSIANNASIDPAVELFLSLHTGDPGEGGTQETSETDYDSYQRVPVIRSSAGWTINQNEISNAATVTFPTCSGGSSTLTHWGIGLEATGQGTLLFKGSLTSPLTVSNGITPEFRNGNLTITCD